MGFAMAERGPGNARLKAAHYVGPREGADVCARCGHSDVTGDGLVCRKHRAKVRHGGRCPVWVAVERKGVNIADSNC